MTGCPVLLGSFIRACCKAQVRPSRSTLLQWSAIVVLALLAFAPAPHFHDTADERDDTCVLCHAYGSPFIASTTQDHLDPTVGGSPRAQAPGRACNAEVKSYGSRGPPA